MAAIDSWKKVAAVTPHDSNPNVFQAFVVGVAGNVVVTDRYGNTATIPAIAGYEYRIETALILSTGTTATGIVGFN